jgi:hypothetical protein
LTADEQKAVKTTAFDLQLNPAAPGFSFHRIDKSKDKKGLPDVVWVKSGV